MTRQIAYIIQGFLLALLIPFVFLFVKKISSQITKENSSIVIDFENPKQESVLGEAAFKGKMIFMQKCAACHNLFRDGTGPSLIGFEQRGTWNDRQNLYAWIRNPGEFMKKDSYTRRLKEIFGSEMTAFPGLTDEEIDNIVAFLNIAGERYGY